MSSEKYDFDPYRIPDRLSAWLREQTEAVREHHAGVFAKRCVAAAHVLKAVNELRAAYKLTEHSLLPEPIRELLRVARDLHDYDPTSD